MNPNFSSPSLSLSVKEQQLRVEVIFPCAPYAICQTEKEVTGDNLEKQTCCPLTDFLPLNTTVTLYNKHDQNKTQVINSAMLLFTFLILKKALQRGSSGFFFFFRFLNNAE